MWSDRFGDAPICLILLFLAGQGIAIEIKEFRAIQADSSAPWADTLVTSSGSSMLADKTMCSPSRVVADRSRNRQFFRNFRLPDFDLAIVTERLRRWIDDE